MFQVGDLHLVVRKLSAELKSRKSPSYPVKITRTVGLQVTLAVSRGRGGALAVRGLEDSGERAYSWNTSSHGEI